MYVCSLSYPACKAPAPYYIVICGLSVSNFSKLSHKLHQFEEKVTEHKMCVLICSTTFVWSTSHSKKNLVRYYYERTYCMSSCKVPVILVRPEWNLNLLDTYSEKYSNIKFHTNPSHGSPVVPYGQRDGQTDTMKLNVAKTPHLWNYNISRKPVIIIYYVKVFQYIVLCARTLCFMWGCVQTNGTVLQHNIGQTCFSHTFTCYMD
jgi:hypothetical protein